MSTQRASPLDAADLLRQLVYLPQASIFVAESRRTVVGGASSPSGRRSAPAASSAPIDLLVVDPDHDADRVTEALLEEVLRSASNKGCTVVEAARPDDPATLGRWERWASSRPVRASNEPWPRRVSPRVAS